MKKNKNKWLYAKKFDYCKDNIDKTAMNSYIDTIMHIDPDTFEKYLFGLKQQYNTVNYLCILENLLNYIIAIFNITYKDYCCNEKEKYIRKVLDNITDRYAFLTYIYNEECKQNEITQREYKKKEKLKKYKKK